MGGATRYVVRYDNVGLQLSHALLIAATQRHIRRIRGVNSVLLIKVVYERIWNLSTLITALLEAVNLALYLP